MAFSRRQLEEQLVEYSHRLHQRGWVANHDGNLTARLADGRLVATPTAVSKGQVARDWLLVLDDQGRVVSGNRKVFSEIALHLLVYRHRPDVEAVIHSHAPNTTALAVAGVPIRTTMLAEPVVSLGPDIPLVPYAPPKAPAATGNLLPFVTQVDAVVLENHGLLTWGPDLETAYLRMELVEHLAKIQITAMQVGRVRDIPSADLPALLEARDKAGLGRAPRQQVETVVKEEVARALRR